MYLFKGKLIQPLSSDEFFVINKSSAKCLFPAWESCAKSSFPVPPHQLRQSQGGGISIRPASLASSLEISKSHNLPGCPIPLQILKFSTHLQGRVSGTKGCRHWEPSWLNYFHIHYSNQLLVYLLWIPNFQSREVQEWKMGLDLRVGVMTWPCHLLVLRFCWKKI